MTVSTDEFWGLLQSSQLVSADRIAQLRSDAYDDAPAPLHNQGFVPQLVVRGSTAPMRPAAARPLPSDPS